MASYGNSPYSGGLNILSSLLSGPMGKGIAESDTLKSILGSVGAEDSAGLKKLIGGLGSTALGAGVGALGGKHNILPGAMSGAAPYAMQEGMKGLKKDKSKVDVGAGGQAKGASKTKYGAVTPDFSAMGGKDALSKGVAGIPTTTETPKETAGIDKLLEMLQQQNDPELLAMLQAPQMAGAFTGMGQTAAYNQYQSQQAKDAAAKQQALQGQSNQAIYNMYNTPGYMGGAGPQFATGGYINTDPVDQLGPMDRVPEAQPYPAASPQSGIAALAHGGPIRGNGDGMSDDIAASIDGEEDARVADGEYLVPKDKAEQYDTKLKAMMKLVRAAAHPKSGEQIKQGAAKRAFIQALTGVQA